jgi:hypothetical protein
MFSTSAQQGTNPAVQDGSRLSRGRNVAVAALRAIALQQKLIRIVVLRLEEVGYGEIAKHWQQDFCSSIFRKSRLAEELSSVR